MTMISELRARMAAGWYDFNPNRQWNGLCDAWKGWAYYLATGSEPSWYPTAYASWQASPPAAGMDPNDAPIGAILWWDVGSDDHVAVWAGNGNMIHAYKDCDEFWGNNYGIVNFARFQRTHGWTFRGWTHGFGPNNAFVIPLTADVVALQPHERRVVNDGSGNGANRRTSPQVGVDNLVPDQAIPPGDTGEMKGYVRSSLPGGTVNGNNIWFVGLYSGNYFHSSSFVGGADVTGLADITPSTPTQPPVTPPIVWPEYNFEAFSSVVTEVIPAHPSNFKLGNFPASPTTIVLHDFGTKGLNHYQTVINFFTRDHTTDEPNQVSSHFVVSGKKIVQMVSLSDRAFHAGPGGNDFIGIEIDPEVSSDSDFGRETLESARTLIKALRDTYAKNFELLKHPEVPGNNTQCGDDIDKSLYVVDAYVPPVIPDPDPQPDPDEPDVPSLPTTVGWYRDKDGVRWYLSGDAWHWKPEPGDTIDRSGNEPMTDFAPFTLIPDPEEPTVPEEPEPEVPVIVVPIPEEVTEEQEKAAADLLDQFTKGNLLVGDAVLARIRTIVPLLVGPLLTWLVVQFPGPAQLLNDLAPGWTEIVFGLVSAAAGFGWWSLARWLGKRWPIAEKLMLGSSKAPVYIDRVDAIKK